VIHVDTGKLAWRVCANAHVVSPSALSGDVLVISKMDQVLALDAATGKELGRFAVSGLTFGGVSIAHGYVLVGTYAGKLFAYALPQPTPLKRATSLPSPIGGQTRRA
jgi:outer membrane protein assembly factor BamB